MKIARLRHRIELQRYKEVHDSSTGHGTIKTWTTFDTVFAMVEPVKGYVTFQTQQIEEAITHKITIRYHDYVSSENWVLMNSRRFRIRNVQNLLEKDRFLVLLCEEVFHARDYFRTGINRTGDALESDLPPEN